MKSWKLIQHCQQNGEERRGAILVLAAALLVLIFIFTAFTTDVGLITLDQTRLQVAVDSATLGASMDFPDGEAAVLASVDEMLRLNGFDPAGNPELQVTPQFGNWDDSLMEFVPSSFDASNALRVQVTNTSIPAQFGTVMGRQHYTTRAEAIASRGGGVPRDVVLVLDASLSMQARMSNGLTRMENTQAAAARLVDALGSRDRVGLSIFSWKDRNRWRHELTGVTEQKLHFNHQPTTNRIRELKPGEYEIYTNIGGGLRAGLEVFLDDMDPRTGREAEELEQIMILLSDGQPNRAEPYPVPDDGPNGMVPRLWEMRWFYDEYESIRRWANTIKARGIKLFVITVSDEAYSHVMQQAASPPEEGQDTFFYHVSNGPDDYLELLRTFEEIGNYTRKPKLVK
ncbi:MAG: VWA domain-containing protein [Planctomycetota bacterium]|nr:MAG: VWA domain-containing protein [Planctomycetota bacterium]REJ90744.1 MAG: VWA domain-containing protein [Planctomycetota bacterium]REK26710.1 MAG: VWA domain-containing protein [Planctomycetota bacterium]REK35629.1 MAG: VWA domain-containing protein [Planctomycetota bacterium]